MWSKQKCIIGTVVLSVDSITTVSPTRPPFSNSKQSTFKFSTLRAQHFSDFLRKNNPSLLSKQEFNQIQFFFLISWTTNSTTAIFDDCGFDRLSALGSSSGHIGQLRWACVVHMSPCMQEMEFCHFAISPPEEGICPIPGIWQSLLQGSEEHARSPRPEQRGSSESAILEDDWSGSACNRKFTVCHR